MFYTHCLGMFSYSVAKTRFYYFMVRHGLPELYRNLIWLLHFVGHLGDVYLKIDFSFPIDRIGEICVFSPVNHKEYLLYLLSLSLAGIISLGFRANFCCLSLYVVFVKSLEFETQWWVEQPMLRYIPPKETSAIEV